METLTAYDYSHPSYKLTTRELFQSLGYPVGGSDGFVSYDLVRYTNHMAWQLSVELRNDYVVGSTINGMLDK